MAAAAPSAAAPACGGRYANGGDDPRGNGDDDPHGNEGKTQRRRSDLTEAARSETAWLRGGSSTWLRLCGWTAFCTASRSKRSTAALEGMQRRLANGGKHLRRSPLLEQAALHSFTADSQRLLFFLQEHDPAFRSAKP
ncbi:unnamed protein product [Cuscuta campestris]|uniref:Uncharacterized protein n=1 Tax=Cuscuta campestris TaxID=132261 RepID=A0A484KLT0_9ASTE|nr:unnamed protein product [Cuscuta campestris]